MLEYRCSARRARILIALLLWSAALALPVRPLAADQPAAIAVFDFELVDTSLEGEVQGTRPDELARLRLISDLVREELEASGRLRMVETRAALAQAPPRGTLRRCSGCAVAIARSLGAEFALIGWVQKVSNLILNINVAVRDVDTGEVVAGGSVDIRGNDDRSWSRGARYLVQHHLLGR